MSIAAALASAGPATTAFGATTVDVAPEAWLPALQAASDAGGTYLDLLTAYDDGDHLAVVARVATPDAAEAVLLRTRVPVAEPVLASAAALHPGAAWHERETHEMFGVVFEGHPGLAPLLLPAGAPVHPLRREVLLDARLAVAWPGEKDPSDSEGRPRRRVPPPGVPADHVAPERSR